MQNLSSVLSHIPKFFEKPVAFVIVITMILLLLCGSSEEEKIT